MDWFEVTARYHERTFANEGKLSSLPEPWQRELAALWRLEAEVNGGGYLEFLENFGRESYVVASRALRNIGARRMAAIIDTCQALVDEHFPSGDESPDYWLRLMPNKVIGSNGMVIKEEGGSVLPEPVLARIEELSYEFMASPDDIEELGLAYYRSLIEGDGEA